MKGWGRSCQVEEVVSTKATRQEELYMVRNRKETRVAEAREGVQGGRQEPDRIRLRNLGTAGNRWSKRVPWVSR